MYLLHHGVNQSVVVLVRLLIEPDLDGVLNSFPGILDFFHNVYCHIMISFLHSQDFLEVVVLIL